MHQNRSGGFEHGCRKKTVQLIGIQSVASSNKTTFGRVVLECRLDGCWTKGGSTDCRPDKCYQGRSSFEPCSWFRLLIPLALSKMLGHARAQYPPKMPIREARAPLRATDDRDGSGGTQSCCFHAWHVPRPCLPRTA